MPTKETKKNTHNIKKATDTNGFMRLVNQFIIKYYFIANEVHSK